MLLELTRKRDNIRAHDSACVLFSGSTKLPNVVCCVVASVTVVCLCACVCCASEREREREKQREIMLGAKRGNECMKEGEEEEKKTEIGSVIYIPTYNVNIKLLSSWLSYFCLCLSLYLFRKKNAVFSHPSCLISFSFHAAFVKLIPIPIRLPVRLSVNTYTHACKHQCTVAIAHE